MYLLTVHKKEKKNIIQEINDTMDMVRVIHVDGRDSAPFRSWLPFDCIPAADMIYFDYQILMPDEIWAYMI